MCLKLESIDNNLFAIEFDSPTVKLDEEDLYGGEANMDIVGIHVNNTKLLGNSTDFKKYAFLDIGFNTNLQNIFESHLYLHLENKLAKHYNKVIHSKNEFDFIDIQIKDEYIDAYSKFVTKKCLKALNTEIDNRYRYIYKKDLNISNDSKVIIHYNKYESSYDVKIENNKLSVIAAKSEVVLSDAHDNIKDFNIKQTLKLQELKTIIKDLVQKLEYEEDYIEEDLFKV